MNTFQIVGLTLIALAMTLCGMIYLVSIVRYRMALKRQARMDGFVQELQRQTAAAGPKEDPANAITTKLPALHDLETPHLAPGKKRYMERDNSPIDQPHMTAPERVLNAPEITGSGYEHSVNDYYRDRRQVDQSVANLVSMLALVSGNPWEVRQLAVKTGDSVGEAVMNAIGGRVNPADMGLEGNAGAVLVNRLTLISEPVASAGEPVNNIGNSRNRVVSVGQRKIHCSSTIRMRELTDTINQATFALLLPHRRMILRLMKQCNVPSSPLPAGCFGSWVVRAGSQNAVVFESKKDADVLCDALNQAYHEAVARDKADMSRELDEWLDRELAIVDALLAQAPETAAQAPQ